MFILAQCSFPLWEYMVSWCYITSVNPPCIYAIKLSRYMHMIPDHLQYCTKVMHISPW